MSYKKDLAVSMEGTILGLLCRGVHGFDVLRLIVRYHSWQG